MNDLQPIDLHAPFGVESSGQGAYHVKDCKGTVAATCTDAGLAYTVALAMNEIAKAGTRTLRPSLKFSTPHPQGGTIEVNIPRDVPGAREDYFDVAFARIRGLVDSVERVRCSRLAGRIGMS